MILLPCQLINNTKINIMKATPEATNKNRTTTKHFELTAAEFEWEISENKSIKAWGFNKSIPGPVLKARKGETLVIKVKNNLSEPTIVHWHGIQLPSSMDGTDDTQRPIQPGETFEYKFLVPDAGTFWYHSHQNETVQMERGMYGALIVEEETDVITDAERIFMIDDMKLTAENEFKKGNFFQRWFERHDGREGDTLLINGKENPVFEMHAGQIERWRFINAASSKYFYLSLGGRPFKIIATDGGLLEAPRELTEILLAPGERIDIIAGPFNEGETFAIESLSYNRTTTIPPKQTQYAVIKVGQSKPSIAFIPQILRKINPLASQDAPATRKVKFSVGASWKHGIDFLINNDVHTDDKPVHIGELQVWEISNTSLMDHPFHLHGFFFQVLEENGKAPAYISWKDTINLKPRSKVKIAWMPDNRPGNWMYHCHILEHHEAGMMAHFQVIDPQSGQAHAHHHHHHHA
jgi:FtsP/CotA-like multicopper oxidase with cupredoxin domain